LKSADRDGARAIEIDEQQNENINRLVVERGSNQEQQYTIRQAEADIAIH
jgi:hypothetical protein